VARPIRIVVVDDNQLILRLLGLVLEEAGFVPVPADSADAALAIARTDPPDAFVVDQEMPGMKGSELVRALRWSGDFRLASTPVIGVSAYASAEDELRSAGACEFVRKPLEEEALLEAVGRALALRVDTTVPAV
jgi:CheY-like chemotaxis protein